MQRESTLFTVQRYFVEHVRDRLAQELDESHDKDAKIENLAKSLKDVKAAQQDAEAQMKATSQTLNQEKARSKALQKSNEVGCTSFYWGR